MAPRHPNDIKLETTWYNVVLFNLVSTPDIGFLVAEGDPRESFPKFPYRWEGLRYEIGLPFLECPNFYTLQHQAIHTFGISKT